MVSLGATVTVNGTNWVKPGVSSGIKWDSIPEEEEIRGALKALSDSLVEPTLEDLIVQLTEEMNARDGLTLT